jgi:hypothetical protein
MYLHNVKIQFEDPASPKKQVEDPMSYNIPGYGRASKISKLGYIFAYLQHFLRDNMDK